MAELPQVMSPAQASAYCRHIARGHYENFTVASLLLPRRLRTHFFHVYAFCRLADDLADESSSPGEAMDRLDRWELELAACYEGRPRHPVFVALAETIRLFEIPPEPWLDLVSAFRQDQVVTRYATHAEVLDYCRRSANPVGRLILYLARCHDAEHVSLSDSICTGLQLANFCQDVAGDWDRGRIYLPVDTCQAFGYDESRFAAREYSHAFRGLMAHEVQRARGYLESGRPLICSMPPEFRVDVALFLEGGLAILDEISRRRYNVWSGRPRLSKRKKLSLVLKCGWEWRWRG